MIESTPGKPPPEIFEQAELEKQRDADAQKRFVTLSQALADGTGVTELVKAGPLTDAKDASTVHGLPLGIATDPKTLAYTVASRMGLRNLENTVESWALYSVSSTLETTQGWAFKIKLDADQKGRPTEEQILAASANEDRARVSEAAKNRTLFDTYFGIYARMLIGNTLQDHLQRAPTDAELGIAMKRAAENAGVDLGPYVDYARTLDPVEYRGLIAALISTEGATRKA